MQEFSFALVSLFLASSVVFAEDAPVTCGTKGKIAARIAGCARPPEKGGLGSIATREYVYLDEAEMHDPLGGLDSPPLVWRLVTLKNGLEIWKNDLTTQVWMYVGVVADGGTDDAALGALCTKIAKKEKIEGTFHVPTDIELELAWKQSITRAFTNRVGYLETSYIATVPNDQGRTLLEGYTGKFVEDDNTHPITLVCVSGAVAPRKSKSLGF